MSYFFLYKQYKLLFQCGCFLDRQIGMEPLVINWAKEEAKMPKIIRHIYVLLIIQFLSRLCNILFSQINSTEGMLPNDEL